MKEDKIVCADGKVPAEVLPDYANRMVRYSCQTVLEAETDSMYAENPQGKLDGLNVIGVTYKGDKCNPKTAQVIETAAAQQQKAAKALDEKMSELNIACQEIVNEKDDNEAQEAEKKQKKNLAIATGVGAGVGAAALGVTTYFATRDIQEAQNDQAKQAAIKEWMDNIGSKIKCYIGADEVGSYGDVVSTTLE